ncbi:hypothetical protein [Methanolobus halotolerans]|nr:hypothetical protein [Methanolobus halotolerans]
MKPGARPTRPDHSITFPNISATSGFFSTSSIKAIEISERFFSSFFSWL